MARTAAPPQASSPGADAPGVGALCDSESQSLESSDDEANQLPFPDADSQNPSDEASGQLSENNRKLRSMHKRLEQRKKNFQGLLKAYQRKEMEFVAQMDSHMDEVEHTEHALSLKIEALSVENHQLRTFNEKRERDNSQLAERLSETTKQCSESETRVQFLVDRIVALLSSGSADQAQTDAVVGMRQREREMLRQLEETRQQFDEVRQQNGELHSRLTEELSLSRRLQEQLVEVEERFSLFQQQRGTDHAGFPGVDSSLQPGLQGGGLGHAALPSASGLGELSMPSRGAGRLGPRPMGLRSDQTEAPPEMPERRQALPELPPPISEVGEGNEPSQMEEGGAGSTLGPVLEGEVAQSSDEEAAADQQGFVEAVDSGDNPECSTEVPDGPLADDPPQAVPAVDNGLDLQEEDSSLTRVQQGARTLPIWPSNSRPAQRPSPPAKASTSEKPLYSRTTSSEGVLLMEQKLREALDRASFECAVVRIENGVYNFGPNVCAVVELTAENEVLACQQDSGDWAPIDDFIRSLAQRPLLQNQGASSTGTVVPSSSASSWPPSGASKASPVDNTVSHSASTEAPSERRHFGPPAKPAQPPYSTGPPQTLGAPVGTPVTLASGHGAVSSTSPRRLAPVLQSNNSGQSPSVTLGRQAAGSTPERVRMPGQPSPAPSYGTSHAASAPQSGGQRTLIVPNSGGAQRYGVSTLSPGRQIASTGAVYQQGTLSPRLQG